MCRAALLWGQSENPPQLSHSWHESPRQNGQFGLGHSIITRGNGEHGPGRNLRETELRRDSRDAVGTRSYGVGMVQVCVVIVVVGVLLWLVTTYIPIQQPIKNILIAVVVIALVLWLLSVFGVLGSLNAVPVPRVR